MTSHPHLMLQIRQTGWRNLGKKEGSSFLQVGCSWAVCFCVPDKSKPSREVLALSPSAGVFLKRSSLAAEFGQFNIYTGQQVISLVEGGCKQQHAKRRTVWIIINLLWIGENGPISLCCSSVSFLSLFLSQIMCCLNKPVWFTACEQCSLTVLTAWFGFSLVLSSVLRGC